MHCIAFNQNLVFFFSGIIERTNCENSKYFLRSNLKKKRKKSGKTVLNRVTSYGTEVKIYCIAIIIYQKLHIIMNIVTYLFVNFRCTLGVAKRNRRHVLQDRHLDRTVPSVKQRHQWTRPVDDWRP